MPPTLQSKLRQLDEYNLRLAHWLNASPEEHWSEARDLALERLIQVVVECAADAGDLWLAEQGKPLGQSAADVFRRLQQAGAIRQELYDRLKGHVGSRNRIIHNYDQVTPEQTRQEAEGLARDIPELIRALVLP